MINVHWSPLPRLFTKYTPSLLAVLQTPGGDAPNSQNFPALTLQPRHTKELWRSFVCIASVYTWPPSPAQGRVSSSRSEKGWGPWGSWESPDEQASQTGTVLGREQYGLRLPPSGHPENHRRTRLPSNPAAQTENPTSPGAWERSPSPLLPPDLSKPTNSEGDNDIQHWFGTLKCTTFFHAAIIITWQYYCCSSHRNWGLTICHKL